MRSTLRQTGALAAAIVVLTVAGPAAALQFVQTRSVDVRLDTDFSDRPRVFDSRVVGESVSFDRFDPSLGVLTGVTLTATGLIEHEATISVPFAEYLLRYSRGGADTRGRVSFSSPLFGTSAFHLDPPAAQCTYGFFGCSAHESASRTGEIFSAVRSGAELAAFVGVDPFVLNTTVTHYISAKAERPVAGPTLLSVRYVDWTFDTGLSHTLADVDFTLTYTYDAHPPPPPGGVPEPGTWALMIGGFGLAGAALRRRKALATA